MVVTYRYTPDRSKGELDSDKFVNSAQWGKQSSQAEALESSTPSSISSSRSTGGMQQILVRAADTAQIRPQSSW